MRSRSNDGLMDFRPESTNLPTLLDGVSICALSRPSPCNIGRRSEGTCLALHRAPKLTNRRPSEVGAVGRFAPSENCKQRRCRGRSLRAQHLARTELHHAAIPVFPHEPIFHFSDASGATDLDRLLRGNRSNRPRSTPSPTSPLYRHLHTHTPISRTTIQARHMLVVAT